MKENINIAEILKDAPNTTKLYSPIYGKVRFDRLRTDNKTIEVSVDNTYKHFDYYGRAIWHNLSDVMFTGEECLLFPSKQNRDWSTFKAPWIHRHFEPGQKVLVPYYRGSNNKWGLTFYSNYDKNLIKPHITTCGMGWSDDEILPYEGNENKLGKLVNKL